MEFKLLDLFSFDRSPSYAALCNDPLTNLVNKITASFSIKLWILRLTLSTFDFQTAHKTRTIALAADLPKSEG